eukprot:1182181-Rhodomonas_salina.1
MASASFQSIPRPAPMAYVSTALHGEAAGRRLLVGWEGERPIRPKVVAASFVAWSRRGQTQETRGTTERVIQGGPQREGGAKDNENHSGKRGGRRAYRFVSEREHHSREKAENSSNHAAHSNPGSNPAG